MQRAGNQFGRALTPADARAIGLDRRVLSELMAEATLEEQAKRLKLGVPQTAVVDAIMQDETFRGPNGAFDPNRFDQILRSNGLNEPMYVDAAAPPHAAPPDHRRSRRRRRLRRTC